jgi:hypothetical protein
MLIDCIRPLQRSLVAPMAISLIGGALYLTIVSHAPNEARAEPAEAAVLVSVGLLDMSRLAPAEFGDWEQPK